ncbi:pimeloyl-ACP methyl ester carboxylesterase [Pedobacter cryoconitis]|uniref:Pimeloyl-ACP methyl ester carboxylesterase n=1 Tax=Pedobacter cryoconitis TaxID=188932 RepID=A0A7W8ZNL2_9SPHI|nr:alpha/beta hydrolase family protein [Pedobacter cryoconitis]MBB5637100.1 pimeloyl-ACP methyl ester carboxylesterase [Pedobacter cryoconitis]
MKTSIIRSISFYLIVLLLISNTFNSNAQNKSGQPVFVLVHGAWHGGWCWQKVSKKLRAEGGLVYTPTLSGLGENKNMLNNQIDLNTHIEDIVNLIVKNNLHHVILVGHSYGGVVIAGVADRIPERLEKLVYLDAVLTENGESTFSVNPKQSQDDFTKKAMDFDKGLSIPPPSSTWFGLKDSITVKLTDDSLTSQPYKTFTQPLVLKHPYGNHLPLIYIACTDPELPVLKQFARRTKKNKMWKYYELKTGHDAMISMPNELTALLSSFK